jgi:hypothetical protein
LDNHVFGAWIPGFHPGLKFANAFGVVARDSSAINPNIIAKKEQQGIFTPHTLVIDCQRPP